MKQKTIQLITEVKLRFDDETPEDDIYDFINYIASELNVDQTWSSPRGSLWAKSGITNVNTDPLKDPQGRLNE